ncbi:hypothetical protein J2Z35_000092 [Acetoanaerobium pronyense]|uniref:Pyruvate kinase n=1 Tax=Acetoanaerobium pronyense TaxID=1482736 RepID=A0ABS4KEW4_9FIRM|nr:DUF3006 domain-containing protein [Acetoanaerobium pronyense]MBP2026303.1 hypothetical protein [Acetoanaerobium pronyense]
MKGIIDRFEEEYAVVELSDGSFKEIKKIYLPRETKEGDFINIIGTQITLDLEESKKRRDRINNLMEDLFEK